MIGYLKGRIIFSEGKTIILDVNNVGYRVEVVENSLLVDQVVELYIYTHVRENEIRLFGFKDAKELNIFEKLIEVDGVGPKAGISLLSNLGANNIIRAIKSDEPSMLKVTGVGLKTTQKIILELKNKFNDIVIEGDNFTTDQKSIVDELKSTLQSLGFSNNEIVSVIHKLEISESSNINVLLKQALQMLSK